MHFALLLSACSKGSATEQKPAGQSGGPGGARQPSEFPVEAHPVESRQVEYTITAVGSLDAFERVAVTARVAGAIERVLFTEGQVVQRGQGLVEIEPERYSLAVASADATLQKQEAARSEAQAGFERRQTASAKNPGLIRGEEIETWRTRVQTAAAEVSQAQAARAQARLNLRDAFVRAPVAGVIQTRTVQTGQYVSAGTVLATLVRRDPLLLRFQVPEQDAGPLQTGMVARFTVSESNTPHTARITLVSAAASSSSRMVDVTANVLNSNQRELNIFSMIGLLLLLGIAKKNSIILVDYAVQKQREGMSAYDAMMLAGPVRLRPILMTSAATLMAAIPPALALGPGAETRGPMAIAIIGGLVISTALSLLVVPAFFVVADRTKTRLGDLFSRNHESAVEEPSPLSS